MNLITMQYSRLAWEMQFDWIYGRFVCCDPAAYIFG